MDQGYSIIVPVSVAEDHWLTLIEQLKPILPRIEILLVMEDDPGPLPLGVRFIKSPGTTRAAAMNRGAATCDRRFLLFLHADTLLSPVKLTDLSQQIERSTKALFYFAPLKFLDDGPKRCLINQWLINERAHLFDLPSGRQGLAISRETFEALGRFDETVTEGEDLILLRKARKKGFMITKIEGPIYSSARRFAKFGWFYGSLLACFKALKAWMRQID